jgi:flagellar hook protein FlgE
VGVVMDDFLAGVVGNLMLPPNAVPIVINAGTGVTLDDIVTEINNQTTASGPQLGDYITAKNVNGYLVIETNDGNYDVEFDAALTYTDPTNPTTPVTDDTLIEVNPDYSGRKGAGAEFMEITTRVDQTSTQSSLQLRLDKLGISDSKFGSFSVDETGLITITEGGVQYAVGQVSIARFTNNQGLLAVGNNNFQATQESGKAIYSTNNNNTSGMQGKTLELDIKYNNNIPSIDDIKKSKFFPIHKIKQEFSCFIYKIIFLN